MNAQLTILRGTLDVLVLRAVSWQPLHGFEISLWLDERSGGQLEIDDSALYQSLHRLEANILQVNPQATVLRVSAKTGEGIEAVRDWFKALPARFFEDDDHDHEHGEHTHTHEHGDHSHSHEHADHDHEHAPA